MASSSTGPLSKICAIVTGGASGLGAATARRIVQHGGKVVVADLEETFDSFRRNVGQPTTEPDNILFCETDVTEEDQVSNALDQAESSFQATVNTVVNCAGIAPAKKTLTKHRGTQSFQAHPQSLFSKALDVNVVGSFNVSRLAAERMANNIPWNDNNDNVADHSLRGCIIHTASIAAYEGQMGQVAYAASKGAIVGMTLPMARDLASLGIRVNTIAPGLFETPLLETLPDKVRQELGATVPCPSRLGRPDEYAQMVESILLNPMVNGTVIRLDGALRMPPK